LRHSCAIWLVSDGVPIDVVSRLMGHEQISTALNRYTHHARDYADLGGDPAACPPVTIAAFAFSNEPPTVLVEVSGSGTPTHVEPWQARRMATALLVASDLVDQARAGG
jgi:hypothetical protein